MSRISSSDPRLKIWDYGRLVGSGGACYQAVRKLVGAKPVRGEPVLPDWNDYTAAQQEFYKKNGFFENEQVWTISFNAPEAKCSFIISLDLFVKPKAAEDGTHWEFGFGADVWWAEEILKRADLSVEALQELSHVFYAKGWYEVKDKVVQFFRQKGKEVFCKEGFEHEKNCYEKAVNNVEEQLKRRFMKAIPQSEMWDIRPAYNYRFDFDDNN